MQQTKDTAGPSSTAAESMQDAVTLLSPCVLRLRSGREASPTQRGVRRGRHIDRLLAGACAPCANSAVIKPVSSLPYQAVRPSAPA